ncbi:MAG: hypothetical protein M1822_009568 [Bathelium mastoideum]|nr:MAG: hypothetical protein M1822_009568 [Bathelium mastoideum]
MSPLLISTETLDRTVGFLWDEDAACKPVHARDPLLKFLTDYYSFLEDARMLPCSDHPPNSVSAYVLATLMGQMTEKSSPYRTSNASRKTEKLNEHLYHTEWTLPQVEGTLNDHRELKEREQACPDCYGNSKGVKKNRFTLTRGERKAWRAQYFQKMPRAPDTIERMPGKPKPEDYSTTSGAEDQREQTGLLPSTAGIKFRARKAGRGSTIISEPKSNIHSRLRPVSSMIRRPTKSAANVDGVEKGVKADKEQSS